MTERLDDDILVPLNDKDLEELASLYTLHVETFPLAHSFLQICLKAKKVGLNDYVTVYSPWNCWREDGTFIASMPAYGHDIVLHSLDSSGKRLIEAFKQTKRFPFQKDSAREYTLFFSVHEYFSLKLVDLLTNVLHHELIYYEAPLWRLGKEQALAFNDLSLSDVYVKPLNKQDISIIDNAWPHRSPTSINKHWQWIQLGTSFGVYLKSNDKLVSWVTSSCLGQMSALQTLEQYKRKGYGSLVVKHMAKYLATQGFDSCISIIAGNVESEGLYKKLGFKKTSSLYHFIRVFNK
ncbi:hypothetical protein ABEB36_007441 [Hypothenemus hampei]|uniref:N-acetyltransferase domain-containing protein n=1 Tax=Hypothenemus hampei TaxID=57062 RepID=A0ABD1EU04_HYPHA